MMVRSTKHLREYVFIAFIIYTLTILLSLLIYFLLIIIEKRIPIVTLGVYVLGEAILNGLNLFSTPLRHFLPNLSDDECYLLLVNGIVTTFAFAYAYLFYILRPELFTGISSVPNTVYLQWLALQRHRFQETRRPG